MLEQGSKFHFEISGSTVFHEPFNIFVHYLRLAQFLNYKKESLQISCTETSWEVQLNAVNHIGSCPILMDHWTVVFS